LEHDLVDQIVSDEVTATDRVGGGPTERGAVPDVGSKQLAAGQVRHAVAYRQPFPLSPLAGSWRPEHQRPKSFTAHRSPPPDYRSPRVKVAVGRGGDDQPPSAIALDIPTAGAITHDDR